ncbi:MAG: DUF2029 domain-containing protein [Phycisphaera sp.]|nr:DUF2029 domain-containing protein [Phycisphaera sp.]
MMNSPPSSNEVATLDVAPQYRWLTDGWVIVLICGLLTAGCVAEAVSSIGFRNNDFLWHYNMGQGGLHGHLYTDGLGQPVPAHHLPGRVLIDALIALLPYRLSRAVIFCGAIAALIWSVMTWSLLAQRVRPVTGRVAVLAGLASVGLLAQVIVRDLDECGLQILLLAMMTAAVLSLVRGKWLWCGLWVAMSITYKTNPALLWGYLVYKRRWKEALACLGFLIVINLALPAAFFGVHDTRQAVGRFVDLAERVAQVQDPTVNPIEKPKNQNFALKQAVARFLMTFPPEHSLFLARDGQKDSSQNLLVPVGEVQPAPGFVQFFDLSPRAADRIVTGILLLLAAALAWRFRRSLPDPAAAPGEAWTREASREWAAMMVLCMLLSPMAWTQHFVLLVPCVLWLSRVGLVGKLGAPRLMLLWVAIVMTLPMRVVLGRQGNLVWQSYNAMTLAALMLMGLVLTLPDPMKPQPERELIRQPGGSI